MAGPLAAGLSLGVLAAAKLQEVYHQPGQQGVFLWAFDVPKIAVS
jgi:hypothetical protein